MTFFNTKSAVVPAKSCVSNARSCAPTRAKSEIRIPRSEIEKGRPVGRPLSSLKLSFNSVFASDLACRCKGHPHQLRHNAATRLRKEFGLDVAQVVLGHKRLEVTQVYAERDLDRARDVMSLVG